MHRKTPFDTSLINIIVCYNSDTGVILLRPHSDSPRRGENDIEYTVSLAKVVEEIEYIWKRRFSVGLYKCSS